MSHDLLIVDLSGIVHMMWHASTDDPNPNATSTKTVERVRALASGQAHVVIACDTPSPSFRKEIDPTYKANRKAEDRAPLYHQMRLAVETLTKDGYTVFAVPGFEADDIIATVAFHAPDGLVTIATSDKDLAQLVGDTRNADGVAAEPLCGVFLKSLKDGSLIDREGVKAKFGVWPSQILDYLALCGDTSDNIKGAEKVGPKGAVGLLAEFGSLDAMYASFDAGATPTLTPNLRGRLEEFRSRYPTVRRLISLRIDVPLDFDAVFRERVVVNDVVVFGADEDGTTVDERRVGDAVIDYSLVKPHADYTEAERLSDVLAMMPGKPRGYEMGFVVENNSFAGKPAFADAVGGAMEAKEQEVSHGPARVMPATEIQQSATAGAGLPLTGPAPVVQSLAVRDAAYERQLEPQSLAQAHTLATAMFNARLFSAYGNAEAVLSTILAGRELGMAAMASLRAFHIVENKPTMAADTIRAIVLRSGAAEYFRCSERTPQKATFITKRRGDPEPVSLTYTIDEGRQAWSKDESGWNKSGWGKNPADMLVARAGAKLARLVYPDVVHGVYAREEFE